jgi:hypothetical protein
MEVAMSKVYPDDKMLRYTIYYIMEKAPEKVPIRDIYGTISPMGEETQEDFRSEVFVQEIEWLYKYRNSYGPGDLKAYLERVMPYTMARYLTKNRKQGYLPPNGDPFTTEIMSDIGLNHDIRKSVIDFGVKISGKTITQLAAELGITYRAARYIMTRRDNAGTDGRGDYKA